MDKIVIHQSAYDKIMYLVNKTDFEISGLGKVKVIDGIPTVYDIILLEQENTRGDTEISAEAICNAEFDHIQSGDEGELKFWWHSHANMQVFWSQTDHDAINQLTETGWFIHGVFNKRSEVKCAYSQNFPVMAFIDDLELEILDDSEEILPDEDSNLGKLYKLYESLTNQTDQVFGLIQEEEEILNKGKFEELDNLYDELVTEKKWTPVSYIGNKVKTSNSYYKDRYGFREEEDEGHHYGFGLGLEVDTNNNSEDCWYCNSSLKSRGFTLSFCPDCGADQNDCPNSLEDVVDTEQMKQMYTAEELAMFGELNIYSFDDMDEFMDDHGVDFFEEDLKEVHAKFCTRI